MCVLTTFLAPFSSVLIPVYVIQEELQAMKQRIRVVVVENEKLHSEIKSKAVDESLKDYTIRNSTVMCVIFVILM